MLEYSKSKYKSEKKFASKKELREMVKHQGLFSQVAQELVDRLIEAVWRFIELKKQGAKCGFPRFKSFDRMKSLVYPQMGFKLIGNRVDVSPFGSIKLKLHRHVKGKIKTLTLKRESSGKWFVVFIVEEPPVQPKINHGIYVGIDLGLSKLAVCSDGLVITNPRFIKKYEDKIAFLNKLLSQKKKGSRNRFKAKLKLARAYEKFGNSRLDFLHKTSCSLVNRYSLISLENLNIKGMVQERFGKQINDAGWGMLVNMLCYKAESAGCKVVFVDPANTTKECSRCKAIVPKALWEREHRCPSCGLVLDRDLNASINILNRTVGHTEINACGAVQEGLTLKQEAHTYT